eukprot:TRINITY_DN10967_c0_g1_i2.p1 TRINITY_DN10967_c0_g1~~TRINITY_DN10967_c0_g1_i2.p1  ORF type:complete len:666 (+),score=203.31 TRINITY_DN10967_c0_g1_i2:76-2073(+)
MPLSPPPTAGSPALESPARVQPVRAAAQGGWAGGALPPPPAPHSPPQVAGPPAPPPVQQRQQSPPPALRQPSEGSADRGEQRRRLAAARRRKERSLAAEVAPIASAAGVAAAAAAARLRCLCCAAAVAAAEHRAGEAERAAAAAAGLWHEQLIANRARLSELERELRELRVRCVSAEAGVARARQESAAAAAAAAAQETLAGKLAAALAAARGECAKLAEEADGLRAAAAPRAPGAAHREAEAAELAAREGLQLAEASWRGGLQSAAAVALAVQLRLDEVEGAATQRLSRAASRIVQLEGSLHEERAARGEAERAAELLQRTHSDLHARSTASSGGRPAPVTPPAPALRADAAQSSSSCSQPSGALQPPPARPPELPPAERPWAPPGAPGALGFFLEGAGAAAPIVAQSCPGSAACKAGVRPGDLVVRLGARGAETAVRTAAELAAAAAAVAAGDLVTLWLVSDPALVSAARLRAKGRAGSVPPRSRSPSSSRGSSQHASPSVPAVRRSLSFGTPSSAATPDPAPHESVWQARFSVDPLDVQRSEWWLQRLRSSGAAAHGSGFQAAGVWELLGDGEAARRRLAPLVPPPPLTEARLASAAAAACRAVGVAEPGAEEVAEAAAAVGARSIHSVLRWLVLRRVFAPAEVRKRWLRAHAQALLRPPGQ